MIHAFVLRQVVTTAPVCLFLHSMSPTHVRRRLGSFICLQRLRTSIVDMTDCTVSALACHAKRWNLKGTCMTSMCHSQASRLHHHLFCRAVSRLYCTQAAPNQICAATCLQVHLVPFALCQRAWCGILGRWQCHQHQAVLSILLICPA